MSEQPDVDEEEAIVVERLMVDGDPEKVKLHMRSQEIKQRAIEKREAEDLADVCVEIDNLLVDLCKEHGWSPGEGMACLYMVIERHWEEIESFAEAAKEN